MMNPQCRLMMVRRSDGDPKASSQYWKRELAEENIRVMSFAQHSGDWRMQVSRWSMGKIMMDIRMVISSVWFSSISCLNHQCCLWVSPMWALTFFETSMRKWIFLTQIVTILHLYTPTTSLWDWKYIWQSPSDFVNLQRITATHTCQLPGWTFIVATCTSDMSHCTCAQWAAYNALHPCID